MALLDAESFAFSTNATDYWTYGSCQGNSAGWNINTGGPLGDNYLQASNNSGTFIRPISTTVSTTYVGFRLNMGGAPSNIGMCSFFDSAMNLQTYVEFNQANGNIYIANGSNGGTALATISPGILPMSSWCYMEIGLTLGTNTGSVVMHMNGLQNILSLTGVNTKGASTGSTTSFIQFTGPWGNPNYAHFYVTDSSGTINNSFLGDVRVQGVFPSANSSAGFTHAGLSANYLNAAKTPPVPGTDYNYTSTVGTLDTFTTPTISPTTTSIFGVLVKSLVAKSDSGSRSMENLLVSGTTTLTGTSTALSTSAQQIKTVAQTDPNTTAMWTLANANSAKIGYKLSA